MNLLYNRINRCSETTVEGFVCGGNVYLSLYAKQTQRGSRLCLM